METLNRRRRCPRLTVGLLGGALMLAACGSDSSTAASDEPPGGDDQPSQVTVTHAQGETTVDVDPETVVVFDLGALVTLDELGVEVTGVPQMNVLPESMEKYRDGDHSEVGTLSEPDYEQVNALAPDLIIIGGRSAEAYDDLAKIGPTVDLTVDNADFLVSFRERAETIGTIFDAQDAVAARLDAIDASVAETKAAAADAGTGLIVLSTGGEVTAYGPGSRFGLIHDVLGVTPAAEGIEDAPHGDAISFEFILEANPDILYVLDRDAAIGEDGKTAEQVLDNELVGKTTAWQNGDVAYLDGFSWYLAPTGLRSVEDMIQTVADSLE